ncbi:D-threo-aldose 1-dehydrogenase [Cupriavidus sp. USMAA2-4]|uniref:aldo/keto reductase n=1 Tax=unclassified Cupriavidus TaxID=2640874 RepID=UPI0008A6D387|nr:MULTISPECIES: aldo/keto reductase [unclassified Cupriavidus]AOY90778.1 D-threo-aldose 1-dehydrogenase [Cupriavidus sp. USMAA2-4]AOY99619.1 D-threo-aldose 1-dehydrogenase [Cupriavidus sp. USMAHM13]
MRITLPSPLGFGTAPLGNMYRDIPHEEALATVDTTWQSGIRYFDAAPLYGAGLAELRLGEALAGRPRDAYSLGTKVGRLILDEQEDASQRDLGEKGGLFRHGLPNKIVYDYTADGTLRSIEASLRRLRTDRLDYVWIHDPAVDFHGDRWREVFDIAMSGAAKALTRLREEKVIRGWGLGVNRIEPCALALERADPDGFLLAGRYTLLDHAGALARLMPASAARGLGIVVGGPYNSGVLAGGQHFEYQPAPPEMLGRVARVRRICDRFGVDVKAVALQFPLAHPAVAGVIPGASRPGRIDENLRLAAAPIPAELWETLKAERLIDVNAPTPAGNA